MTSNELELSVSEFVAVVNQTLDYAYSHIAITGELANFRVSKGQWVYFDLKDELASVKCFGTVYQLPGPLEDGMLLQVKGAPRLHPQYGFSFNVQSIRPVGEGAIRKAADLLELKLSKEGLFDESRKRSLKYPPSRIGLIASSESAAYVDFIKILNERWGGIEIVFIDVPVQGETAPPAIVSAIEVFNQSADPPEVLVITRGGGSAEDLWAFNAEKVTRAVAASRVPTLVAIGHEVDISLAERVADRRASTPSNAAQMLTPYRKEIKHILSRQKQLLSQSLSGVLNQHKHKYAEYQRALGVQMEHYFIQLKKNIKAQKQLMEVLNPNSVLKRGYAIIRHNNRLLRSGRDLSVGAVIDIDLIDSEISAYVNKLKLLNREGKDSI